MEVLKKYGSEKNGLTEEEAKKRLDHYGPNTIEEKTHGLSYLAVRCAVSPVNIMVFLSFVIFFITGKVAESIFSLFLLTFNFLINVLEEYKSEKEVEALKKKVEMAVEVKRDGVWKRIKSAFIVPGDVVRVGPGEMVPADTVILEGKVVVDESSVTGESFPKEKEKGDEVYASSVVRWGTLIGIVTRTGRDTKYGRVVHLVQSEKARSNLENVIVKVSTVLIAAAILLSPAMFLYMYFVSKTPLSDAVIYASSIFVSFIPAALPAVASCVMLNSAKNLSKVNILIRRLSSVFDIGLMNVLCMDKTGTLTRNEIRLDKIVPIEGSEEDVLYYAYLSSDPETGDQIDMEIIRVARKRAYERKGVIEFFPYDSVRKYSKATVEEKGEKIFVAKGSPEVLIKKLGKEKPKILDELYEEGYRVLAVVKENSLLGLLAFYDPPLEDAKETIEEIRELGVNVKMLTGDSSKAAERIAREVGIKGGVISKEHFSNISEKHYSFLVEKYDVFAEIFPEDKYEIVSALRKKGYKVGATGDGINDIGAIKKADVGIAVFNATNATKSFSDIILTAPGLRQLVHAIKDCRKAISKLENYIIYRIAEDIRYPFLLSFFLFAYGTPILSPIYVLLLKVLNDIPILAIAFDDVDEEKYPKGIDVKKIIPVSIVLGIIGILNSFIFVYILKWLGTGLYLISSLLFLKLILSGHFLLYVVRTKGTNWFKNLPSKPLLLATLSTQLIGTAVVCADLYAKQYLYALWLVPCTWIYALVWMNITDVLKIKVFKTVGKAL